MLDKGMEMSRAVVYIHGMGGNAGEAEHYRPLFPGSAVTGFDYRAQTPWDARDEFRARFMSLQTAYDSTVIVANSIGAYFAMQALGDVRIEKAFFISPIIDMERLVVGMMRNANVTERELEEKGTVETARGEVLSWRYLSWVREHPVKWNHPTAILYGDCDNLQPMATMKAFAKQTEAELTVMQGGEHWFHTETQMAFLDAWIRRKTSTITSPITAK